MENTLYYGDNLFILKQYLKPESVDLIYLDPPFNSSRNYNILFKDEKGKEADSQIVAFEDTWHWTQKTEEIYHDLVTQTPERISNLVGTLRGLLGTSQMMAYLVMMIARLVELHRVLKPTGSLYLHCDPTASHYLRVTLDAIFNPDNFCGHITWQRSDTHNDAKKQFSAVSDHILYYRKSDKAVFNPQYTKHPLQTLKEWYQYLQFSDGTIRTMTKLENETQKIPADTRRFNPADMTSPNPRPNLMYDYKGYPHPLNGWRCSLEQMQELDQAGLLVFPSKAGGRIMRKRFLDEQEGVTIGDVWTDISHLRAKASERLGYPTQKPLALLERIIKASSNPGDVVLDPFCGCGTATAAAEKLGRQWIGIDITHLAIAIQKFRMQKMFPDIKFKIIGEPADIGVARQLAQDDRYQFQWWALSLVRAMPIGGLSADSRTGKKGSDKGIDGIITFIDEANGKPKKVLVQVKSGKVGSALIRDLRGTLEREKAAIAAFITLETPTKDMQTEAVSGGYYTSVGWGKNYPKIQILTIEDLMKGKVSLDMPATEGMFKAAKRTTRVSEQANQANLFGGEQGDAGN